MKRTWLKEPRIRVSKIIGDSPSSQNRVVQWEALRSDGVPVVKELGHAARNSRGAGFRFPKQYFDDMLRCNCPAGEHCEVHKSVLP
jgi:hypothetical protein